MNSPTSKIKNAAVIWLSSHYTKFLTFSLKSQTASIHDTTQAVPLIASEYCAIIPLLTRLYCSLSWFTDWSSDLSKLQTFLMYETSFELSTLIAIPFCKVGCSLSTEKKSRSKIGDRFYSQNWEQARISQMRPKTKQVNTYRLSKKYTKSWRNTQHVKLNFGYQKQKIKPSDMMI